MKIFLSNFFIFFVLINQTLSNEITLKISENWNEIKSMSGSFKQTDTDGNISEGKFYFLKPYKSRFEYDGKQENIITNQRLLKIVDKAGYQIDSYPIGNNILKKILSNEIDISKEFSITDIKLIKEQYQLNLKLNQKTGSNQSKVYFDRNTFDLKKWEIFDEFENKTVLEFTKIKKNIFISEKLFVVKYRKN